MAGDIYCCHSCGEGARSWELLASSRPSPERLINILEWTVQTTTTSKCSVRSLGQTETSTVLWSKNLGLFMYLPLNTDLYHRTSYLSAVGNQGKNSIRNCFQGAYDLM